MKKLFSIAIAGLALSSVSAFAFEDENGSNGCRAGFSNASLSKVLESARVLEGRVAPRYELYLTLSTARNARRQSASNSITIEAYSAEYAPLELISERFNERQIESVCVRPNPSSYYAGTVLEPVFEMDYGVVHGNSYQLDVVQPYPVN